MLERAGLREEQREREEKPEQSFAEQTSPRKSLIVKLGS
jgi:hypothetical protein